MPIRDDASPRPVRGDVRLRPVTGADVRPLIALEVHPDQAGFVAPNAVTLAQRPYETGSEPFVIEAGGEMVGLVAVIDCRVHDGLEEGDDPNAAFLWRLMVAKDHQRRGIGRAAMERVKDWCRAEGLPRIVTSVVPGNDGAAALYESVGMTRTGRWHDDEAEYAGPVGAAPD